MAEARGRDNFVAGPVHSRGVRRSLHSQRIFAVAVAVASPGCLPEAPPPWQVDHTIVAAQGVEVVARGPWGSAASRDDREVAEVMPGDTIRPRPFVIGPDGPIDEEDIRPRYFYCRPQTCLGDVSAAGGVRDCDDEEPVPPRSTCELRGGQLTLGAMTELIQVSAIFMVSGTPDGPGGAGCVERMRGEAGDAESLRECLLRIELVPFGPTWRLLLLAAASGLADAVPLSAITPDVTAADPNLYPGAPPLRVLVTDPGGEGRERTAQTGDTITVRPGAEVVVTAEVDPADAQRYFYVDSGNQFSPANEALTIGWLFTEFVEWTAPDLLTVAWTMPGRPGPFHLYALVGDGDAITPTWLRFEIEAP